MYRVILEKLGKDLKFDEKLMNLNVTKNIKVIGE